MTISTLIEELTQIQKRASKFTPDPAVMILTRNPSIGPRRMTDIKSVYPGIDWDNGRVVLRPEEDLVLKEPD